jgi:acyl-CoA reductase-like NAD-dependent aldehyde dehydrogenase
MQYERVKGFLDDAHEQKQNIVLGGEPYKPKDASQKGYFINPTIIDNPKDDDRIVVEEPFGKW